MKKTVLLLMALWAGASAWADAAQERADEDWRLREMSEGLARRDARGLELATDRGWQLPKTGRQDWIWVGLRVDAQFHELRRSSRQGQTHWAWVSRRSGRWTQFPAEPETVRDRGFVTLAGAEPSSAKRLQAWFVLDGELQALDFSRNPALQGYVELVFGVGQRLQARKAGTTCRLGLDLSQEAGVWTATESPCRRIVPIIVHGPTPLPMPPASRSPLGR